MKDDNKNNFYNSYEQSACGQKLSYVVPVVVRKSLELCDGTASGTRYHQLNDAQDIQRDLLPIHFHTRCL